MEPREVPFTFQDLESVVADATDSGITYVLPAGPEESHISSCGSRTMEAGARAKPSSAFIMRALENIPFTSWVSSSQDYWHSNT
jgi:hypothetical protein